MTRYSIWTAPSDLDWRDSVDPLDEPPMCPHRDEPCPYDCQNGCEDPPSEEWPSGGYERGEQAHYMAEAMRLKR